MTRGGERGAEIKLPENPVHKMRSCQRAANEIRVRVGKDQCKSDFAWNVLRDRWLTLRQDLLEFVSGSGGVLVKNHKNPGWFAEKEASPGTLWVLEKRKHVYQLDGKERVLMLDQLLDLEVLIGRQLVDIRRSLNRPVRISPEFALLRGIATARAAGLTADLDCLKPGRIVHRHRNDLVLDITPGLIDWLKLNELDEVPTPEEYSSFHFLQSFRAKDENGLLDCPGPENKENDAAGADDHPESGVESASSDFDGKKCTFCRKTNLSFVRYDGDVDSGVFVECRGCGAEWDVTESEGVRRFHLRNLG